MFERGDYIKAQAQAGSYTIALGGGRTATTRELFAEAAEMADERLRPEHEPSAEGATHHGARIASWLKTWEDRLPSTARSQLISWMDIWRLEVELYEARPRGSCRMLSQGDDCPCAACRAEARIERLERWAHAKQLHPDFDYTEMTGQRKGHVPEPSGRGWEVNTSCGRDGRERDDFTDTVFYRRPKALREPEPPAPTCASCHWRSYEGIADCSPVPKPAPSVCVNVNSPFFRHQFRDGDRMDGSCPAYRQKEMS